MPRNMVHPRLKRILSESSSAVSSPPDTTSDPGKPEPESEDQDPEVESPPHSNQKGSDAEQEVIIVAAPESPGSKMDISDEDADGAPKVKDKVKDKVPIAETDASSDTQKPGEDAADSGKNTPQSASLTVLPLVHDGTPPGVLEPSVKRDESPQPRPGPSKSTSRSPSVHSTKDFKDTSPAPASTSVSANLSPAPQQRPSLKIKLKLGARSSKVVSEAEAGDEKPTRGRRGRPRGSGKGKAKAKGRESARALTFTIPPRPRTDPSEVSTRPSVSRSRSQSSQHSSVESEDAEDADAESENENDAHPSGGDQNGPDEDGMDVDLNVPSPHDRLVDDVESEGDGDMLDDEMDGGGVDEDNEVLPRGRKARLTARQAVLASMVGADHVELEASTSSRKKQLTTEEIALRREETARKRKNMSEKKLEDEKTETINRLLKKQSSRSRTKRSTLLNSSVVPTPQSPHSGDEGESDAAQGAIPTSTEQTGTTLQGPTWRWVSNKSEIRLGIPSEVLEIGTVTSDGTGIVVQHHANEPLKPKPLAICNVSGCVAQRKYRLVHDFERGACGLDHLRILKSAA